MMVGQMRQRFGANQIQLEVLHQYSMGLSAQGLLCLVESPRYLDAEML